MTINLPFSPYTLSLTKKRARSFSLHRTAYDKVFVIGFNKTGTTSIKKVLQWSGLKVGRQEVAEMLALDWPGGSTDRIIRYCHTADAFQDLPFSKPGLFRALDQAFPRSKFILSVRDSPEQWYKSLVNFHTKRFASDKSRFPTEADLANADYRYRGFMLDLFKNYWQYPQIGLYAKQEYIEIYQAHLEEVTTYFANRPEDLLVINVSRPEDFGRFCDFLQIRTNMKQFPVLNKT